MSASANLRRDLTRKIADEFAAVMERELNLARLFLSVDEMALMAVELAASNSAALITVVLQFRKPETVPAELYDSAAQAVQSGVDELKAQSITHLLEHEASRDAPRSAGVTK